jgi:hypothetical protein
MRKPLLLTVLIPILMISGCVIPGTDIEIPILSDLFGPNIEEFRHDVIVIQSLQAIPSHTIRSGQTLTLRAYVKNLQEAESDPQEKVEIELYDDCGIFKTEGVLCTGGDFDSAKRKCTIGKMYPKSTAIVDWKMTADPLKIETPCNVGVLVRYKYTTYTTSSASFVNQEEYENLVMQGKTFNEKGTIVAGEGPVKSYIEVPDQPIMVDIRGGVTDTGKGIMTFWVENKGSGELENNKIAKEDIKIECAGGELLGCDKCREEIDENGLQLIGKISPKISCEIEPRDKGFITQEKTYQLTSEITYYYKFTKKIKLTIEPQIDLG